MIRLIVVAALAANCLAVSAAAEEIHQSVIVRHDDLDLTRAKGRSTLDLRIARAADLACGPVSDIDIVGKAAKRRCVQATKAAVVSQRTRVVAQATAFAAF